MRGLCSVCVCQEGSRFHRGLAALRFNANVPGEDISGWSGLGHLGVSNSSGSRRGPENCVSDQELGAGGVIGSGADVRLAPAALALRFPRP